MHKLHLVRIVVGPGVSLFPGRAWPVALEPPRPTTTAPDGSGSGALVAAATAKASDVIRRRVAALIGWGLLAGHGQAATTWPG
jgi:hypothetical protein